MARPNYALIIGIPVLVVLALVFVSSAKTNLSGISGLSDIALADEYACVVSLTNTPFLASKFSSVACQNTGSCFKSPSSLSLLDWTPLGIIVGLASDDVILEAKNSDTLIRKTATLAEGQTLTKEVELCTRAASISFSLKDAETQEVLGGQTVSLK